MAIPPAPSSRLIPRTKSIPVVILTAVRHELNEKFAMEMGAEGYVTKPFNIQELIDVITPLLAKAL